MGNPVSLYDLEAMAKTVMSHNLWDFVAGGAADEVTLERNTTAFREISINPRYLADLNKTKRDLSTTVLGKKIGIPIMAAPTGGQSMFHPDAEVAVAEGAAKYNTLTTVATGSSKTVEEIAKVSDGPLWLQIYHRHDDVTEFMIKKAETAGFSAVVLTVDGINTFPKERDLRNDLYGAPREIYIADLENRPDLLDKVVESDYESGITVRPTWEKLEWFKSLSSMPLIIKGIMTPQDAEKCVQHQVDGILVSNHGGRIVDTSLATIEALPSIADCVGDQIEIFLDSGIRRGTDVFKALALGAKAVLVGRPVAWGLSVDGSNGIETMFEILKRELESVMNFAGIDTIDAIEDSMVNLGWYMK